MGILRWGAAVVVGLAAAVAIGVPVAGIRVPSEGTRRWRRVLDVRGVPPSTSRHRPSLRPAT